MQCTIKYYDNKLQFLSQQERLDQIERRIAELTNHVDTLLKKLDILESVRKSRK